jgi:hypothetical protein
MLGELRFALRGLTRNRAFTAATVLTLALGIGANTAVFTLVDGVLIRPLPFRDSEQLVSMRHVGRDGKDQLPMSQGLYILYKQRVNQRVAYARGLLKGTFDFSGSDRYEFDREDAPWAADSAALDVLWKQSVKNDWLRLKLAGKSPEEIRKTLDKRYANLDDGIADLNGEDVFQTFLNAYAGAIDPHTDYFTPRSAETDAAAPPVVQRRSGAWTRCESRPTRTASPSEAGANVLTRQPTL